MFDDELAKRNKTEREYTIFRLLRGGAPTPDVVNVIKKMLIADKEDFTDKQIEEEIDKCYAIHINEGNNGPKFVQGQVEEWIKSNKSNGACYGVVTVSLRDCYQDFGYKTPNEKASVRMAFKRLVEKGVLEQVPNKSGIYRTVNSHLESIDFMNADTTPYPVKWPLGVHEKVMLYQKSLVVVAGMPNAGKTAFLLNTAWLNMVMNPRYFSSEMGAAELQVRLKKFPHNLQEWQKVKFFQKAGDFPRVIDPDGFNIIDYLEVSKDFFEIGGLLTDIFNTLNKGIAVVAIQKPKGREVGIGGERTLDKARLYLSIDPGELKIVKGKLWRDEHINPNGQYCKFRLGGGANFVREGEWRE